MYGPERLQVDLKALGFETETIRIDNNIVYILISKFQIQSGRFAGRIVDIGFQATPDYPQSVSSAMHVRSQPHLFDCENIAGVRNIIQSALGEAWRYWSLAFSSNWDSSIGTRRLVSLVNEVFNRA